MIGTLLVLAHFLLRKLGLTCSDAPSGWPAYVCQTHEGGARPVTRGTPTTASTTASTTVSAASAATAAAAATASVGAGTAGTIGIGAGAGASATTVGGATVGAGTMGPGSMAQQVAVPVEAVKSPCVITIPNPPFPGTPPCPGPKYYEPQKMPFVIDNNAQVAGYGAITPTLASGAGAGAGAGTVLAIPQRPFDNCITMSPSGVVTPCAKPNKPKADTPPAIGGKTDLNLMTTTTAGGKGGKSAIVVDGNKSKAKVIPK